MHTCKHAKRLKYPQAASFVNNIETPNIQYWASERFCSARNELVLELKNVSTSSTHIISSNPSSLAKSTIIAYMHISFCRRARNGFVHELK